MQLESGYVRTSNFVGWNRSAIVGAAFILSIAIPQRHTQAQVNFTEAETAQKSRAAESSHIVFSDEDREGLQFSEADTVDSVPASTVAYVQDGSPLAPVARPEPSGMSTAPQQSSPINDAPSSLQEALLGNVSSVSLLPPGRIGRASSPGADAVLGDEAVFRKTTDSGNLIGKSISVRGVSSQQRTPITTDTRVRGERTGQLLATGSYWAPVRMDLDTMMSKIDSRLIDSLIVIKGPYSPRYGPGFSFIDIDMISTPRYEGGYQTHGTSSAEYLTNGEQWYGRQTIFGGSDNWGFRMSYGHRTGNDYSDGDGVELPSSYNSRDVNIALGHDIGDYKRLEFNYLRLDQTNVEYPGLVFDMRYLITDGYELKYFDENRHFSPIATIWFPGSAWEPNELQAPPALISFRKLNYRMHGEAEPRRKAVPRQEPWERDSSGGDQREVSENPLFSDFHTSEVWYNRTRFEGDTLGAGKNAQIPQLREILFSPSGFDGFGVTDGDGSSLGYRTESIFGDPWVNHTAIGTDMILLRQGINDREALLPADANNFPLPKSASFDFGFYAERVSPINDFVRINTGARIDTIRTTVAEEVLDDPYENFAFDNELDQNFTTWTTYINAQADLTENWIGTAGFGYGQRPPTLTELYVRSTFIGSLQRGLTYLDGDYELKPETLRQLDLGIAGNYERMTMGANWYYSWIDDYITYDLLTPGSGIDGLGAGAGFVNTNLATLAGCEAFAQFEATSRIAFFGTLSYVEGTDRTRTETVYLGDTSFDRSGVAGIESEPLPGIAPLDSRVGILIHDGSPARNWGIEYSMRAVGRQTRVAATLEEIETAGFLTMDVRGYRRFGQGWLLTGGVENLTDRFYREHLDYRSGFGVFRPGIGFYSGLELNY